MQFNQQPWRRWVNKYLKNAFLSMLASLEDLFVKALVVNSCRIIICEERTGMECPPIYLDVQEMDMDTAMGDMLLWNIPLHLIGWMLMRTELGVAGIWQVIFFLCIQLVSWMAYNSHACWCHYIHIRQLAETSCCTSEVRLLFNQECYFIIFSLHRPGLFGWD